MAGILYRIRQFWHVVSTSKPTNDELAPARDVLTPSQMALFSRMHSSEQKHSLRVMHTLKAKGQTHPDLMVAALLHDVGKIRYPLRIWERIFIVLGKLIFPDRVKSWGQGSPRGWRRPFVIAEQHPSWGAELALQVGVPPMAVFLIRWHQDGIASKELDPLQERLLLQLMKADNQQ